MGTMISYNNMVVNNDFLDFLRQQGLDSPDGIMRFQGGLQVKKKSLRTVVKITGRDRTVYLKRHIRTWGEMFKSLFRRRPVEDARNEWENILLLEQNGFSTMTPVAFGEGKRFGLTVFSFTITEEIPDAEKMETYLPRTFAPPLGSEMLQEKRRLIRQIGELLRDFHYRGFNHQDFYLGHLFFRPAEKRIFIADLQRMHRENAISHHDRIKDAAQLLYSCALTGVLSRTDLMRLAHAYFGKDRWDREDKGLMRKILAKTERIAHHDARLISRKGQTL